MSLYAATLKPATVPERGNAEGSVTAGEQGSAKQQSEAPPRLGAETKPLVPQGSQQAGTSQAAAASTQPPNVPPLSLIHISEPTRPKR